MSNSIIPEQTPLEVKVANAIKWLDELATTELPQGQGRLGSIREGFCCLGVGCKLLELHYISSHGDDAEFNELAGIARTCFFIEQNDEKGFSFAEIAEEAIRNPRVSFELDVAEELTKHYKTNT